jgi:hypothetical protein
MNRCVTALMASAVLCIAPPATAQDVCIGFLENHSQDAAWAKACIDFLEGLPTGSMLAAGSQSQQSMGMGASGLFAETPTNASVTTLGGNGAPLSQQELMIATDPPTGRVFVVAQDESLDHLFAAYSDDLGDSWMSREIAPQSALPSGPLPDARGDPWTVFDTFGNLWISYLGEEASNVPLHVARSVDAAPPAPWVPFSAADVYTMSAAFTDKPVLATGPDTTMRAGQAAASLWVVYQDTSVVPRVIVAQGAALDANGDIIMNFCGNDPATPGDDAFCPRQEIVTDIPEIPEGEPGGPQSEKRFFTGDIEIGPSGKVLVTYFSLVLSNAELPTEIFVEIDSDGLGSGDFVDASPGDPDADFETYVKFNSAIPATFPTSVQSFPYLSWDRDTNRYASAPDGRIHLVFMDADPANVIDTDVLATYSDDLGQTWHTPCPGTGFDCPSWATDPFPIRVSDDTGTNSQFHPYADVDQTTGDLGVVWRDARDDAENEEAHIYASIRLAGADGFLPNIQVTESTSKPLTLQNAYYEYLGVEFENGRMDAAWADNSNNNPAGMDPFHAVLPEPSVGTQMLAGMIALMGLSAVRSRARVR